MSRIRSVLSTTAILMGSSAALLTGGIAKADTAPAPAPAVPGLSMIQDLVNPAKAPQLLQSAATLLTGAPAAVASVTAPPVASAAVTLPQQSLPGVTPAGASLTGVQPAVTPAGASLTGVQPAVAPAAPSLPLFLPAVPSAAGIPGTSPLAGLIPTGEVNLPTVPGLPIPLPHHLTFPDDLAALMPGATGSAISQPSVAPAAAATAPVAGLGTLFPTSALP